MGFCIYQSDLDSDAIEVGDFVTVNPLPHRFPDPQDLIKFETTIGVDYSMSVGELRSKKLEVQSVHALWTDPYIVLKTDQPVFQIKVLIPAMYGDKDYTIERTNWNTTATTYVQKCTCDSRDLFHYGCKCGQFKREMEMKK